MNTLVRENRNASQQRSEQFVTPAASVSGIYLGHPDARYFSVGRIGRDQVEDYAARKGGSTAEAERWLRPNLAYEPADDDEARVSIASASSGL